MRAIRTFFTVIILLAAALLVSAKPVALAQSGGPYNLTWSNIGPGGAASGGSYSLDASIGQPDAGTMSGGSYDMSGGFLPGGPPACALAGDFNGSGQIDVGDVQIIAGHWQESGPSAYDLNGSGSVTVADVLIVAADFGQSC